jgi:hypothetical protein
MSVIFNPASVTGGGGMSIGGAITGGTPNSVLFVGPGGVLSQDNANLNWTDSTTTLGVNGTSNFTGALTGPTVAGTDNSTNVATTAFVKGLGYQTGNQVITLSGDVTGSGATAITTSYAGNLPTSKLNGGTGASSTTFWRGDGTWATPAGGGGMSIGGAVTSGTPGSVLFVGAGAVLAQDSTNFTWDDTNKYLKIGSSGTVGVLYINAVPAIFEIPNASGNNWFEGNSGNLTVTGSGNFATGDSVMGILTTGSGNCAIGGTRPGHNATLQYLTTGDNNFAMGTSVLANMNIGVNNIGVGSQAMENSQGGGGTLHDNTAIGAFAASTVGYTNTGIYNTIIGGAALKASDYAIGNTIIGHQAGQKLTTTDSTVIVGILNAMGNVTAAMLRCTFIGGWQGPSVPNMVDAIAITDGGGNQQGVDFNWTSTNVWAFQKLSNPVGLHVYNTTDGAGPPPTNYERAILDWNVTANVFRVGYQAGGSGAPSRLIAIDAFSKAGAPAAGDLPAGTCAFIDDTTNNQTWLVFNKAGTVRKVQLV